MPTIHTGDVSRPTLLSRRANNLHVLPPAPAGPTLFERISTLSLVASGLLALWIYFLVPTPASGGMEDPDIWWHLRNAAIQWHTHAWLHHDLYSFTAAGAPWINHEWLSEVPFYIGWRLAGTTGLYIVTLVTIEFILLGVYWLTRLQSKASVSISLLTSAVAALLATVSFGPRMLLFGWACLIVELLIMQRFYSSFAASPSRCSRTIFALPFLFMLWINLHGSWLIGFILLVVFIASGSFAFEVGSLRNVAWQASQWKQLVPVLVLSLAALFANPYGWHLVAYPFDMAFHQPLNIASAEEWKPLNFQTVRGVIFLITLGTLFLAQLTRRITWTLWELAFAAIGIYSACRHSRFLFLGAILVMPLLGKQLAHCLSRPVLPRRIYTFDRMAPRPRPWLNALVLAATLALAMVASLRNAKTPRPSPALPAEQFPTAALPYLRHFHPQGRLFNEYLWGGYLAYNVPRLPPVH